MQKFYSLFDKYSYLLVLGLIIFIPLYPKFPLFNVSMTFVAIRIEDFLIGLIVLIWFVANIRKLRIYISQTIVQTFLLFWFIGGLSVFSGIFVTHSVEPSLGILHFVRRIEYMMLFFVSFGIFSNIEQVKLVIKWALAASAVVIAYGFGQIYLNFPVISTTNSEFSKGLILRLTEGARVNSTFAGHYDLAMYLTIVLILVSALFFYEKKIVYKVGLVALGLTGFLLLGLTAARVSFVATIVALSIFFLVSKKRVLLLILLFLSVGLVVGIPELRHRLVATLTVNLLGGGGPKYAPPPGTVNIFTPEKSIPKAKRADVLSQVKKDATDPAKQTLLNSRDIVPGEPINTTELGVYRSFGIRFDVEWPRALNAFYKNPFLGTGYSSITLATDNDYLRSFGETGLFGTMSFAFIFACLIKKMILFLDRPFDFAKYFIIGMLCVTLGLLITAVFIDVFEASKIAEVYWLLMGIAWAVMVNFRYSKD